MTPTSAAGARIIPLRPPAARDQRDWIAFLDAQLPPEWLPGEWDPLTGNLTPLPDTGRFRVLTCSREGCTSIIEERRTCERCTQDRTCAPRASKGTPSRTASVAASPDTRTDCLLVRDGVQCARQQFHDGLCRPHTQLFRASKRHRDVQSWLTSTRSRPYPFLPCAAAGCTLSAENRQSQLKLCINHANRLRAKHHSHDIVNDQGIGDWLADPSEPRVILRIGRLNERLQAELRFVIHKHLALERSPLQVAPYRALINKALLWKTESLAETIKHPKNKPNNNTLSVQRFILETLQQAERHHTGYDVHHENLIYLQDLKLRTTKSARRELFHKPPLDLGQIAQEWLREGFRNWLLTVLPQRHDALIGYRATVLASQTLDSGPRNGHEPGILGAAEMSAIIGAMNQKWPNYSGAKGVFRIWRQILDTGHRSTLWKEVPRGFSYNPRLHRPPTHPRTYHDTNRTGHAIPEAIVAHLRNNLSAIQDFPNKDLAVALLAILIDTGRRPNEVATLRRNCLQRDHHGDWILLFDNHKSGRMQVRLPIQQETADAINTWLTLEPINSRPQTRWLFPSPMNLRSDQPVSYGLLHGALKRLLRDAPPIQGPVKNLHGETIKAELSRVHPHAFRHSYAQRHVDNGTTPDELRVLLDHDDIRTTMGYYQVNDKRKRAAAELLAPLTYDRTGQQIGISTKRRALAAVAVPYGGCTEPSNVKAGGTACPIRFQCSGCTFYRPDPSYLPDIERHLVELKTNAAQARRIDAPPHVIANFDGQVEDFRRIVDRMRADLDLLPEDDQEAIRSASAVLRHARLTAKPGARLPLRPVQEK